VVIIGLTASETAKTISGVVKTGGDGSVERTAVDWSDGIDKTNAMTSSPANQGK
jgi:hypothetical protein